MSGHTPTPWHIVSGDDYYIAAEAYPSEFIGRFKGDDTGDYLAFVGNRPADFGEANAAFIVKACNSHDALVAEIERLRAQLAKANDPTRDDTSSDLDIELPKARPMGQS